MALISNVSSVESLATKQNTIRTRLLTKKCAVKLSDEKCVQINPFKINGRGLKLFHPNMCSLS